MLLNTYLEYIIDSENYIDYYRVGHETFYLKVYLIMH